VERREAVFYGLSKTMRSLACIGDPTGQLFDITGQSRDLLGGVVRGLRNLIGKARQSLMHGAHRVAKRSAIRLPFDTLDPGGEKLECLRLIAPCCVDLSGPRAHGAMRVGL